MQRLDLIIKYVFACLILNSNVLLGQNVLNLRFGLGYYEEFKNNKPSLYTNTPWVSNPYVNVEPLQVIKGGTWLLLEGELEYIRNQKFAIKSGYLFNMGVSAGISYSYSGFSKTQENVVGHWGREILWDAEYLKVPLQFQYKVFEAPFKKNNENSGRVSIWPLVGVNYLRFFGASKSQSHTYHSLATAYYNYKAIDGNEIMIEEKLFKFNMNNVSFLSGINFKFHNIRSEIFSFAVLYEHVFFPAIRFELKIYTPNKTYYYETYGKGNNLSFKLSFPIFSYNFTKKKFYRD